MTIDQAKDAAELLASRGKIIAIQKEMKLDRTLAVLLTGRTISIPEEALPYIEEALVKAKDEIETPNQRNRINMTDIEIQKAAEEIFKDSEHPVPNTYCFIKGAKWALSHQWNRVEDRVPPGTTILLCTSLMQDDRATALCVYVRGKFMVYNGKITNKEFYPTYWMQIPQIPDEL